MTPNLSVAPAVLIIGAGPVGLTMACELARHGIRARIVDADEGPTTQSRALGIQARTLEVFENVGVVKDVLALARKIHGLSAFADGKRITHISFDLEALETHYPYLLILPQGETERILVKRLERYGIEVEWRTSLRGLKNEKAGVLASLAGRDGTTSTIQIPWLIGCDGARSAVRKSLNLPFEGAEYEESFFLADVRLDLDWDRPEDEMTIILTPDGPLIAFPFPEDGRWRLVHASAQTVETVDVETSQVVALFQAMLQRNGWPEVTVSNPTWTSAFKIHRRVAAQFREGHCFLAGDAAHIHSPAGGQGMNTGIQDAYNLAWKLALVIRGESPDSLLDSYSPERRSVVAGVVKGSDLLTRLVTLRNPVAKSLRDHLVGLLGEFDFVARKLSKNVSELGVEYHASPIVGEDRGSLVHLAIGEILDFRAGPHPGERLPDVFLEPPQDIEGPRRLFEILQGTKHVLIVFEGEHITHDADHIRAVLEVAKGFDSNITTYFAVRGDLGPASIHWDGLLLRDHEGLLHHRFGARAACLYLIRPDGYLGYRCVPPDPDRLKDYLARIFGK